MSDLMEKPWLRGIFIVFALGSLAPFLQAQVNAVDFANMREDVQLLKQRVQEQQLRIEQLEHDNQQLKAKAQGATQSYATVSQLNDAVADLSKQIKAAVASGKSETIQQVSVQIEKLAKQTNAALESMAKNVNASRSTPASSSPISSPIFSEDYPKEGITYTVQKGETLSVIAKKTGGAAKDIINANKLSDPSKIHYGQTLFIPGGK